MRILVTGTAGFIGFHLARRLLAEGHAVTGLDAITPYYDQTLKLRRHALLAAEQRFAAYEFRLEESARLAALVKEASPEVVVHLAAQAGVRYSAENPRSYIESNIVGTFNLLETLRAHPCRHLLLASTSSAYGASPRLPFEESQCADRPLSLYAASKIATEALAHSHSHGAGLPTTVMRLFTVYGPWGRPDMALFKFVQRITAGEPIEVYGHGKMTRDFTYVDDVIEAVCRLVPLLPQRDASTAGGSPVAPYRVVNVGGGQPVWLEDFIATIEAAVGRKAIRNYLPDQPGDSPATQASPVLVESLTGFRPQTPLAQGVGAFVAWYDDYYRL
jgi:UDP-glucuronate 4-epimerase